MTSSRFFRRFDPLQRAYLWSLGLGGAAMLVLLNIIRLASADAPWGVLGWVDLLKSEVFLGLGLTVAGLASLGLVRRPAARKGVLLSWQLIWILVGFVEISAHQFFLSTGSTLDYYLLSFSLKNLTDTFEVIDSEVARWIYVALPLYVGWVLGAPWVVYRKLTARAACSDPLGSTDAPAGSWRWALAAVLLLGASALPSFTSPLLSARARAASTTLALTTVEALRPSLTAAESSVSPALNTRLEPLHPNSARPPRNVVFLVLESMRASSTTIYNPALKTTPFLADLATRSTVVEHAYTLLPHSSKALVAILCGIEPNLRMPITEAIDDSIPARCLAELLGAQGYQSAFFQSARSNFENRTQLVRNMGFDDFFPGEQMDSTGFERANYFGFEDDIMLEPSRKWLEQLKDQPFFATYFTLTPHHDYLAPRRYGRLDFAEDDTLNRYLNTLHYVDNFIKNIFDQYKAHGLYENTIFVLVGDHGEGLGEHGRHQHDNVIYQEGIRVPMLIFDPQDPTPRRIGYNANHLDLMPTVLKMLGFRVEGGSYPGVPLTEIDHERPMYTHCWYERRCMARILGDKKYIHHFDTQPDEFFDLGADPDETQDLARTREDLGAWRRDLIAWRERIIGMHQNIFEDRIEGAIFEQLPPVQHRLDARFGDEIRLHGYDISADSVAPGGAVRVTWYFESLAKLEPGWQIFVHTENKGKRHNFDHVPVHGLLPMELWIPSAFVADQQTLWVPHDWRGGDLVVYLGLWNRETGARKPVHGSIETDGNDRALVLKMPIRREKRPAKTK